MSLTYSFDKAKDIFDKMLRDGSSLDKTVSGDNAFNFVTAAFHLKDWIEMDRSIPKPAKSDLKIVKADKFFKICQDLCNSTKHMKITQYIPSIVDASSAQGYGIGRYGKGDYSVGEESITITH